MISLSRKLNLRRWKLIYKYVFGWLHYATLQLNRATCTYAPPVREGGARLHNEACITRLA